MFPILAIVLFLLAAFGKSSLGGVNLVDLGLACLAFALLIGNWPIGVINLSRRP